MKLSKKILTKIKKHLTSVYPLEACGLIVNNDYIQCENIHSEPHRAFKISSDVVAKYFIDNSITAVVHSHPVCLYNSNKTDPRTPTLEDQISWQSAEIPWLIFSTDGQEISEPLILNDAIRAPLVGREFIHGVYDCLSIVRDYYKLVLDIDLPNHPRAYEWWQKGYNLYQDNFKSYGFYEINSSEATIHDVALFQVASPVINHAAVITNTNEIIHHLINRKSGHDSLSKWSRQIVKYVRHETLKK